MSDSLHKEFDDLCAQMAPAQHKCNETYNAWNDAVWEWKDLIRRRDDVWSKMLDSITDPLPKRERTL